MTLKRILTILLLVSVFPSVIPAQTSLSGDLVVKSSPQGAMVELKGDVVLSGVAPARFNQLLVGPYDLRVTMKGFENYKTSLLVDPTRPMVVDVQLVPKTRFKSFARSLFIPGWGQRYSDQRFKGNLFTILSLGSVVAYFVADNDFDDKYDEYKDILGRYDNLTTIAERQSLYPSLIEAQKNAYDAENIRRVMIGAVVGIWGLNLLDALFFFPENRGTISIKNLSLRPGYDGKTSKIQLSMNF